MGEGLLLEKSEEGGFLGRDVETLGLDSARFVMSVVGELGLVLVEMKFKMGEFLLEGPALGEEICR